MENGHQVEVIDS